MGLTENFAAFLLAVVVVTVTPGPAVALIIRRAALRGARYGMAVVVGLEIGLYAWALLVASGFAVVAASQLGFLTLKVVGCAVLGWFAFRSFRAWWQERRRPDTAPAGLSEPGQLEPTAGTPARERGLAWAVAEGFTVQMANPKAPLFLLALYPQFVPDDRPLFATTVVLALLQVALETVLYAGLVLGVASAGAWFRRSVVRRRLEAITGVVMTGLGVRLALSQR